MDTHQLHRAQWRTSTHSGQNGSCIQVAGNLPGIVAVRDSKNPEGPELIFASDQWQRFATSIKARRCGGIVLSPYLRKTDADDAVELGDRSKWSRTDH